ncbi:unnamed protein product [Urochloa humidicola]
MRPRDPRQADDESRATKTSRDATPRSATGGRRAAGDEDEPRRDPAIRDSQTSVTVIRDGRRDGMCGRAPGRLTTTGGIRRRWASRRVGDEHGNGPHKETRVATDHTRRRVRRRATRLTDGENAATGRWNQSQGEKYGSWLN